MRRFVVGLVFVSLIILLSSCGSSVSQNNDGGGGNPATVTISITPTSAGASTGGTLHFDATVAVTANQQVSYNHQASWSIDEGAPGGTISSAGDYTAPQNAGTFHVRATAQADSSKSAVATVVITTLPLPQSRLFNGIWGSGPNDVWAVGANITFHWDGTTWAQVPVDSRYGDFVVHCSAVWGTGPTDVWLAGESLSVEFKRWAGNGWTDYPPNDAGHYVWGIWGTSTNNIWAVGNADASIVYHWDGSSWGTRQPLYPIQGESYFMDAVWGSGTNDVWAVGGGDDSGSGLRSASMFHWDGSTWTQYLSGLTAPLLGIWGAASNDIWVVGEGGLVAHWDGTAWTRVESGTSQLLWSVWGSGPNDVWAVGDAGTVLHWNGSSWSPVLSNASQGLRGVWGSGPQNIWAVGENVILHLPQGTVINP